MQRSRLRLGWKCRASTLWRVIRILGLVAVVFQVAHGEVLSDEEAIDLSVANDATVVRVFRTRSPSQSKISLPDERRARELLERAIEGATGVEGLIVLEHVLAHELLTSRSFMYLIRFFAADACAEVKIESFRYIAPHRYALQVAILGVYSGMMTITPDTSPISLEMWDVGPGAVRFDEDLKGRRLAALVKASGRRFMASAACVWESTGREADVLRSARPLLASSADDLIAGMAAEDDRWRWLATAAAVMACRELEGFERWRRASRPACSVDLGPQVMEPIRGDTLRRLIQLRGRLDWDAKAFAFEMRP